MKVREKPKAIKYIKDRDLTKSYLKAKNYIENGFVQFGRFTQTPTKKSK